MNDQDKIKFLFEKAQALASSIHAFLETHKLQENSPITDLVDHIDWVNHFEKALAEYDESPKP